MNTENPAQKEDADLIHLSAIDDLSCARQVLELASAGLDALAQSLDDTFIKVIDLLESIEGRVVVSGMGKSGHVAQGVLYIGFHGHTIFFRSPWGSKSRRSGDDRPNRCSDRHIKFGRNARNVESC